MSTREPPPPPPSTRALEAELAAVLRPPAKVASKREEWSRLATSRFRAMVDYAVAEGRSFLNRRSRVRVAPGAPQETRQTGRREPAGLGTPRELPRGLAIAVQRTAPRTVGGAVVRRLVAAYEGVLAGDEKATVVALRGAAKISTGGRP